MSDLYDVMMVPEKAGQRLAPRSGEALLRNLATLRIVTPTAEAVAKDWVEVYCEAGPSAHELFVKGAYDGALPVFEQCVVRFGTEAIQLPFGRDTQETFYLLFIGARFDQILGPIRTRFKDITYCRPALFTRPSEGPVTPREVPEDEQPAARRRKETGSALAGTRVEEW